MYPPIDFYENETKPLIPRFERVKKENPGYSDDALWAILCQSLIYPNDKGNILSKEACICGQGLSSVYHWAISKQCYIIERPLQEAFENTEIKDMDLQAFSRLPFPSIYIETPDNPDCIGCFATTTDMTGVEKESNPDVQVLISWVYKRDGQYDLLNETLPLYADDLSSILVPPEILNDMDYDHPQQDNDKGLVCRRMILNALLYLSQDEPEIKEQDKKHITRYDQKKKRYYNEDITRNLLAPRYTKEIRNKQREIEAQYQSSNKRVRPHWRRGHWHTYLVGKGRQQRKINWVKPVLCGIGQTEPVVRKVV